METSPADMQALVNLLNPQHPRGYSEFSSDSEDEFQKTNTYQPLTPAGIGARNAECNKTDEAKVKRKQSVYEKTEENKLSEGIYDPETDEFFPQTDASVPDWKKNPEWDISYKQNVTPSDVFLSMSGKSPATFSCEDMIVTIKLPGESRPNIDLKVLKDTLQVTSPQYFLRLTLPHAVDPKRGNSKWDPDTETLICELRMDREFDFVNF